MDALTDTHVPLFADAIGGRAMFEWLQSNQAFEQCMEQGYAELPIDPEYLNFHAPRIYAGHDRIIRSPLRERFRVDLTRNDETGEDMESGDMRRADDEDKNQFHVYAGLDAVLRTQGAPLEGLEAFFASSGELDAAGYQIACNLGVLFDRYNEQRERPYPGSLAMRFADGKHLTRALEYLEHLEKARAADAKPHIDRSGCTVHWESTHPGLTLWNRDGKAVKANETCRNSVLIFPSRKIGIVARSWFPTRGTVHGVRDGDRSIRIAENRRALVSFPHCTLDESDVTFYRENKRLFNPDPETYPI